MTLDEFLSRPGAPTATAFARLLNLNPDQVRQWRHGHDERKPSPENCVLIEQATGGLVTRKDLRPDDWQRIWPELAEAVAPAPAKAGKGAKGTAHAAASEAPRPPVDAPAGPVFMYGDRRKTEREPVRHRRRQGPRADARREGPSHQREGR